MVWTKYSPRGTSVPTSRRQEERGRAETSVAVGGDRKPRIYFCGADDETAIGSSSGSGSGTESTVLSASTAAAGVAHYMRVIALLQVGFRGVFGSMVFGIILRRLWL